MINIMKKEVRFNLRLEMHLYYSDLWKVKKELFKHMILMHFKDFRLIGAAVLDNFSQKK